MAAFMRVSGVFWDIQAEKWARGGDAPVQEREDRPGLLRIVADNTGYFPNKSGMSRYGRRGQGQEPEGGGKSRPYFPRRMKTALLRESLPQRFIRRNSWTGTRRWRARRGRGA